MRALSLLAILAATPLHAQVNILQFPNAMSVAPDGTCSCVSNGKTWPCRKAYDISAGVSCPAVAIWQLICPEDKTAICTYGLQSTCPAPSIIEVCYAADEPK